MSLPKSAQDVLLFWFGPRPYAAAQILQRSRIWFGDASAPELQPQTDELIRERFGALLDAAERGECAVWESSPRRRLALIVVLDQFSRNIYRSTARAFEQDHQALTLTLSGMQYGADAALEPVERIFFYMPLMHAESTEVQDESVAAFRRLLDEAPTELHRLFQEGYESATLHRSIITRFGRFPHRNHILGRDSSSEEMRWLASEQDWFGQ